MFLLDTDYDPFPSEKHHHSFSITTSHPTTPFPYPNVDADYTNAAPTIDAVVPITIKSYQEKKDKFISAFIADGYITFLDLMS